VVDSLGLTDSLGSQAQAPGLLDKIGNAFGNPLLQAAITAYLGGISTPRAEGVGRAIGQGGLEGLQAFNQARELQQTIPQQQARTQLLQSQAQTAPLQRQLLERQVGTGALQQKQLAAQLAPISADEINKLNFAISVAPTQQEKAYYGFLKTEYQNRRMSADELAQRLDPHMAALMNAQAKMYGNMLGYNYLTGQPLTPPPGIGGAPSPTGAPSMAPAGGGAGGAGADPSWATAEGDSAAGLLAKDATDCNWYHVNPDGSKGAAWSPGGP
jgi:hypothetical protein